MRHDDLDKTGFFSEKLILFFVNLKVYVRITEKNNRFVAFTSASAWYKALRIPGFRWTKVEYI